MSFILLFTIQSICLCLIFKPSSQMEVIPIRYYITFPNTYEGGILIDDCNINIGDLRICPITTRLTDNITGEGHQFNVDEFIGWNNSFRIVIETSSPGIISQVNIYFYNNPSIGYGLAPLITARYSFISPTINFNPIQTSFLENSDLSQNDDIVTKVSLILTNEDNLPYDYLELSFDPSSAKINQVFLSEIRVFNGTDTTLNDSAIKFLISNQSLQYGSNNVQSSVELSCTVINEGSFTFSWMGPNGVISNTDRTQLFSADTSRTSILTISQLNLSDSGIYTCMSSYRHTDLEDVPGKSSTVSLTLEGSVTHLELVEVLLDDIVVLECNFTGYLPSPSVVIWRDEDGNELSNTDGFNISTDMNGSGYSQRGGDSLEKGVRSILSISLVMDSDLGDYMCEMDGTNIQGTIRLRTSKAHSSSTSSRLPSPSVMRTFIESGSQAKSALSFTLSDIVLFTITPSDIPNLSPISVIVIVIAGIVVLITAGVIILSATGLYLWKRSKKLKLKQFNMTQNELYIAKNLKVFENAAYGVSQKDTSVIYEEIDDM